MILINNQSTTNNQSIINNQSIVNINNTKAMKKTNILKTHTRANNKSMNRTPYLNSDINSLEHKNPLRAVDQPGNGLTVSERTVIYNSISCILGYINILSKDSIEDVCVLILNLICDTYGNLFVPREIVYSVLTGALMKHPKRGFTAGETLSDWVETGILKEYSSYNKGKCIAREAKLKRRMKKISNLVVEKVKEIVDNDLIDLMYSNQETFYVTDKKESQLRDFGDLLTDQQQKDAQTLMYIMYADNSAKDQFSYYSLKVTSYKDEQRKTGITTDLLIRIINDIIPGYQPERKAKILTDLIDYYNLIKPVNIKALFSTLEEEPSNPKEGHVAKTHQTIKEPGGEIHSPPPSLIPGLVDKMEEEMDDDDNGACDVIVADEWVDTGLLPESSSTPIKTHVAKTHQTISSGSPLLPGVDGLVPAGLADGVDRDDGDGAALVSSAIDVFLDTLSLFHPNLCSRVRSNLSSFSDYDSIDKRQRYRMLSDVSPFPTNYVQKGDLKGPRVYSSSPDDLTACRKAMRFAALSGMGAVDVDMTSCHTYILLNKWGDRLPILEKAVTRGSLWDMYKEHYESHDLPFAKKAVKAMHYASVLGGGPNAFSEAIHRYNLDNPADPIVDQDEFIRVHKLSPIYKELKSLLSYIQKEWEGKEITLPTGQTFKVKGFRRYKRRDGTMVKDQGNLLSVFASYLQSYEVLLMSHMILETGDKYLPLLWQHDGITIIPWDKEDYLAPMQASLNKACENLLGDILIPLSIEEI